MTRLWFFGEHLSSHGNGKKQKLEQRDDGAAEIGFTVAAITLVIVVVFLPIAMSTGLVANILAQFCVTVVIATLLSLLASFTIIPWLSIKIWKITTPYR